MIRQIAVFSDVHANLPALKAVLEDIDTRRITEIYCLGDLVDFAPWPNEVIELLRQRQIPTVMGNHDDRVAFDRPVTPMAKHSPEECDARVEAIALSKATISAENMAYLRDLPFKRQVVLGEGDKAKSLLLVHASANAIHEYIYQDHSPSALADMCAANHADGMLMGHTHCAYLRQLATASGKSVLIGNTGATGRIKLGQPLATYMICTWEEGDISAEIVAVEYNVVETASAIIHSPIPDFYARELITHSLG
ncbi:metallophosphoesterase family protein [Ewingella sp. AOP8-B2-18]|jgi:predicted phosphodiesterase